MSRVEEWCRPKGERFFPSPVLDFLLILLLVTLAVTVSVSLNPHGSATSPDSLKYLDAAGHVGAGHGVVMTDHRLNAPQPTRPLTQWPPLYPIALSPFVAKAETPPKGAALFSALALGSSVIMMYLLLRTGAGRVAGVIGTLAFVFNRSTLTVFSFAWSETLFVPLLFMCCWVACLESHPLGERTGWRMSVAPLFLAASLASIFYCRYIGLAFSVVFVTSWALSRDKRHRCTTRVAALGLYLFLVSLLLARNLKLTGNFSGGSRPQSTMSVVENLRDLWAALFLQIRQEVLMSVCVVVAALVAGCLFAAVLSRLKPVVIVDRSRRLKALLVTASTLAGAYCAGLVAVRTLREFDRIDVRLVTPCVVFLILVATLTAFPRPTARLPSGWTLAVSCVALAILGLSISGGIAAYRQALTGLSEHGSPSFEVRPGLLQESFTGTQHDGLVSLIEGFDTSPSAVFITEDPWEFAFVTGRRSRQFPQLSMTDDHISKMNDLSGTPGYIFLTSPEPIRNIADYYGGSLAPLRHYLRFWDGSALVLALPLPPRAHP